MFTVWQRNCYEHIVHDGRDWNRIRQYIVENPLRWKLDPYYCVGIDLETLIRIAAYD
jgi:hypothetical protein